MTARKQGRRSPADMVEELIRALVEEDPAREEPFRRHGLLEEPLDRVAYVRLTPDVVEQVRRVGEMGLHRADSEALDTWSAPIGYVLRVLRMFPDRYPVLPAGSMAELAGAPAGPLRKAPVTMLEKLMIDDLRQEATRAWGIEPSSRGGKWGRANDSQVVAYALARFCSGRGWDS